MEIITEEVNPLFDISLLKVNDYFVHNDYEYSFFRVTSISENDYIYAEKYDGDNYQIVNFNYTFKYEDLNRYIKVINDEDFINNITNFLDLHKKISHIIYKADNACQDYYTEVVKYENKKKLVRFTDVLKHHFDDSHYELNIVDNKVEIILKYDDVTIENSEGDSHLIKSMFVKLHFNNLTNKFENRLEGYRGDISIKELCSTYAHSHLSTYTRYFQTFCLGASELSIILNDISNKQFNADTFDLLLYTIAEYVKWESLEGGPYIKIKNLNYNNGNTSLTSFDNDDVNNLFSSFMSHKFLFNTKFNFSTNKIEVVKDEHFVKNVTSTCPDSLKAIVINDVASPIMNADSIKRNAKSKLDMFSKFKFKGETYPKLYEEPEFSELFKSDNIEAQPKLVNALIEKLETQINIHFLNKLNDKV